MYSYYYGAHGITYRCHIIPCLPGRGQSHDISEYTAHKCRIFTRDSEMMSGGQAQALSLHTWSEHIERAHGSYQHRIIQQSSLNTNETL